MVGDRVGVVKTEHLEAYGGTASQGDQAAQHFGLQQVMVGVVVSLAEEKEIGANQTGYEILAIDKSGGGDIPDTPAERMMPTKSRFPRRDRAPHHGKRYDDQCEKS
jgi:hypothetical protein